MSVLVAEYGVTADNLIAARFGDNAFVMVPKPTGDGYFVATRWRMPGSFADWNRDWFFGHGGDVEDEHEFHAHVEAELVHHREKAALDRERHSSPHPTPWGLAQDTVIYGPGVTYYATPSHGGFFLEPDANSCVRPALHARDGWYEHDGAWSAVAITFPQLFTTAEHRDADASIRNGHPDVHEAIHGIVLKPGESHEKDRRAFHALHTGDWIVSSAIHSAHRPGFTEVVATIGDRHRAGERRRFLVPRDEYQVGRFGFVIDPARHEVLPDDAPSSFIGWRR